MFFELPFGSGSPSCNNYVEDGAVFSFLLLLVVNLFYFFVLGSGEGAVSSSYGGAAFGGGGAASQTKSLPILVFLRHNNISFTKRANLFVRYS